ncbi:hypothetical protein BS47DRAFT_1333053 [Hydnum rufescens UP504]|uniref:Retrotransposon gag domain-containing protein n=1 Tax=Hydnum rufescens UP504 TaxID=1448309 RepID=A0A9P6ALA5_9AGAM|nr:hypothetical protein BS47DRAFT_1333053 [Hydnum rufescens UP504]
MHSNSSSSIPKLPPPSRYNGTTDYDRFESWISEVSNYYAMMKFPRDLIPQHIQNCLNGKASKWYVMYIARHPKKWNLETITKGLFDWCFPPEFQQLQQDKFNSYEQCALKVRDYIHELQIIASQIVDITPWQLVQCCW